MIYQDSDKSQVWRSRADAIAFRLPASLGVRSLIQRQARSHFGYLQVWECDRTFKDHIH